MKHNCTISISDLKKEQIHTYQRSRGGVEDTRLEAKAKDSLSEDRHSRGQGQKCSRPRTKDTSASALQKKKKVFTKIFQAIPTKKRFPKNFSSAPQNFNISSFSSLAKFLPFGSMTALFFTLKKNEDNTEPDSIYKVNNLTNCNI